MLDGLYLNDFKIIRMPGGGMHACMLYVSLYLPLSRA